MKVLNVRVNNEPLIQFCFVTFSGCGVVVTEENPFRENCVEISDNISFTVHPDRYDYNKYEFLDEIEEKSYDEDGHFEYYDDMYDDAPIVLDDWVNAFFMIVVSYYSIRKVKFIDAFPGFDKQTYTDGYVRMKDYDDVSALDSLIDKHIKTFNDIETVIQEYRNFIYSCGMEENYFKNRKEFTDMLEENKPDGSEFKTIMKWQTSDIKKWICGWLVRTFED